MLSGQKSDVDYPDYICEKCGRRGVTEDGMDIFIALLCRECFEREWAGYVKEMERDRELPEAKERVEKRIDEKLKERK